MSDQRAERIRALLVLGDLDKDFHRPECECQTCEQWRTAKGRPTRKELEALLARHAAAGGPGGG